MLIWVYIVCRVGRKSTINKNFYRNLFMPQYYHSRCMSLKLQILLPDCVRLCMNCYARSAVRAGHINCHDEPRFNPSLSKRRICDCGHLLSVITIWMVVTNKKTPRPNRGVQYKTNFKLTCSPPCGTPACRCW